MALVLPLLASVPILFQLPSLCSAAVCAYDLTEANIRAHKYDDDCCKVRLDYFGKFVSTIHIKQTLHDTICYILYVREKEIDVWT